MSQFDDVSGKLLAHATATDAGFTTNKGAVLVPGLNQEDFPFAMVTDPSMRTTVLDYQQREIEERYFLLIVTKAETAAANYTRLDAILAAIEADPTLTGSVDSLVVESIETYDDPRTDLIYGEILVTTSRSAL